MISGHCRLGPPACHGDSSAWAAWGQTGVFPNPICQAQNQLERKAVIKILQSESFWESALSKPEVVHTWQAKYLDFIFSLFIFSLSRFHLLSFLRSPKKWSLARWLPSEKSKDENLKFRTVLQDPIEPFRCQSLLYWDQNQGNEATQKYFLFAHFLTQCSSHKSLTPEKSEPRTWKLGHTFKIK